MTKKLDLRFLLSTVKRDDTVQFRAHLVLVTEEGKVRNLSSSSFRGDPEFGLADLVVSAQADADPSRSGYYYAVQVQFEDTFVVDIHRAEAMVKVLRKVRRVFDAVGENLDWGRDLETTLNLASQALGVKGYLYDGGFNGTGNWGHDGRHYVPLVFGQEAAEWAARQLAEARGVTV